MPKASEIAAELRRIADAFDLHPETVVVKPSLAFYYFTEKDTFLDLVRIMPRPLAKTYPDTAGEYERLRVDHKAAAVDVEASIYQSAVCRMVAPARPAEFECEPLLSRDEDAALTEA